MVAATKSRVTILGHSATSVLKWMGREGFSNDQAKAVCASLASGPLADSTIATGMSDGRNPKYQKGAADIKRAEARQLKKASKPA